MAGGDSWPSEVEYWTDVKAVYLSGSSDGDGRLVALRRDGSLYCVGATLFENKTDNIADWTDITAISAGWAGMTMGLRSDGTVCVSSKYYDVNTDSWTDVASIEVGDGGVFGVRKDGTVLTAGYDNGSDDFEAQARDIANWSGITQVASSDSAFESHTLGLRSDGTVVATGSDEP